MFVGHKLGFRAHPTIVRMNTFRGTILVGAIEIRCNILQTGMVILGSKDMRECVIEMIIMH